jgi:hypothetical protein
VKDYYDWRSLLVNGRDIFSALHHISQQ